MRNHDFPRQRRLPEFESDQPSLLTLLIVVNFGTFLIRTLFSVESGEALTPPGYISMTALHQGHWWTVFTHLFVHQDFLHLTTNMLGLWMVGRAVLERLGARHFGYIYFLGGLAGSALELCLGAHEGQETQLIGASGAVFAVFGAYAVLHPDVSLTDRFRNWVGFSLRVRSVFVGLLLAGIILEILGRYLPPGTNFPGMNVSHLSHVGGGLFGLLYAAQVRPYPTPFRGIRPAASHFLEEFSPDDAHSPFVPAGSSRRRTEQEEPAPVTEPLTDREFIQQTVNPVLEKLHTHGLASLSPAERTVLAEAATRLKK